LYIVNMKRLMLSPKTDWSLLGEVQDRLVSLQGIPWSLLGEVQNRLVSPRRGSRQTDLS
jgi:hypothetical protein